MKLLLEKNDMERHSTHNEGKSVIAERFIWTVKNKIYKYMTSVSKDFYIDKLDDIVNEYNKTYQNRIKIKPGDLKLSTYIDFSKEVNEKDPKFKIGDTVKILKHKNIFAKGYVPNWSEEVLWLKKVKSTVPWTYFINDLNGEKLLKGFTKTNSKNKSKRV